MKRQHRAESKAAQRTSTDIDPFRNAEGGAELVAAGYGAYARESVVRSTWPPSERPSFPCADGHGW